MEKWVLLSCMFAASSAFFFPLLQLPGQKQSVMNLCVYSMDPNRYQPKCFLCPSSVYSNVLMACVNSASIPRNITYTQATCLEQNCAINRGKRSVDAHRPQNLLEELGTQLPPGHEDNAEDEQNSEPGADIDQRISVEDEQNGGEDGGPEQKADGYKIVGTEEFMAVDVQDFADYEDIVD